MAKKVRAFTEQGFWGFGVLGNFYLIFNPIIRKIENVENTIPGRQIFEGLSGPGSVGGVGVVVDHRRRASWVSPTRRLWNQSACRIVCLGAS